MTFGKTMDDLCHDPRGPSAACSRLRHDVLQSLVRLSGRSAARASHRRRLPLSRRWLEAATTCSERQQPLTAAAEVPSTRLHPTAAHCTGYLCPQVYRTGGVPFSVVPVLVLMLSFGARSETRGCD